ncbi:MAG: hypothetical protein PHH13_00820 [Candidatus Peribacteraceae bacterium]|nr:hypothetical protein [Candidatus Peribacteraceae bacterium]
MAKRTPDHEPGQPKKKKFGPHLRLEALLAKECTIETSRLSECNQLDIWRHQRERLICDLAFIGLDQGDHSEITVADLHDREELIEALLDLVHRNRFNPDESNDVLGMDRHAIECECGIKFGKRFWSMREPFIENWQGRYRPDAARRELLKRVIEEEKQTEEKDQWPLEDRVWDWAQWYFRGGCPREVEVPEDQDPEEVLRILDRDCAFIEQLSLSESDCGEAIRSLIIQFLSGEYPIVTSEEDPVSEEAMLGVAERIARAPDAAFLGEGLRGIAVSNVMKRYREYLAQGLSFEAEEAKRGEEQQAEDRMLLLSRERAQREYDVESAFLQSLNLPDYEAQQWPELLRCALLRGAIHIDPAYRERVHGHVRCFIGRMPWPKEELPGADPWGPLGQMLASYWHGHYYPDNLRWRILQEECAKLPPGFSERRGGLSSIVSTYLLHVMFMEGCANDGAKVGASQDPEMLEMAYANDMQLIRNLGLPDDLFREAEWGYNEWLLGGNFMLAADRELPEDRDKLARRLAARLEESGGDPAQVSSYFVSQILQEFCEHWLAVSKRPAPRKE